MHAASAPAAAWLARRPCAAVPLVTRPLRRLRRRARPQTLRAAINGPPRPIRVLAASTRRGRRALLLARAGALPHFCPLNGFPYLDPAMRAAANSGVIHCPRAPAHMACSRPPPPPTGALRRGATGRALAAQCDVGWGVHAHSGRRCSRAARAVARACRRALQSARRGRARRATFAPTPAGGGSMCTCASPATSHGAPRARRRAPPQTSTHIQARRARGRAPAPSGRVRGPCPRVYSAPSLRSVFD
ncbi:MAG: hypothetical protein J3K34DRAFT_273858 [Monoraphidium minutum]|nr:MAG: hypothetical protein J3K34DRAFT_273858 [Monoraphidium minutum]